MVCSKNSGFDELESFRLYEPEYFFSGFFSSFFDTSALNCGRIDSWERLKIGFSRKHHENLESKI